MRTLAIDPTTGDWTLTDGRLTLVDGAPALTQRLRGRLRLHLGTWFADLSVGLPWFEQILGRKGAEAYARSALRRAIVTCPGVLSLDFFTFSFDGARREASVAFRATGTDGEVAEDGGFRVGAA